MTFGAPEQGQVRSEARWQRPRARGSGVRAARWCGIRGTVAIRLPEALKIHHGVVLLSARGAGAPRTYARRSGGCRRAAHARSPRRGCPGTRGTRRRHSTGGVDPGDARARTSRPSVNVRMSRHRLSLVEALLLQGERLLPAEQHWLPKERVGEAVSLRQYVHEVDVVEIGRDGGLGHGLHVHGGWPCRPARPAPPA